MARPRAGSASTHSQDGAISENVLESWSSQLDLAHFPDITCYLLRVLGCADGIESILQVNIYEALARVVLSVALEQNLCAQQRDPSQAQYGEITSFIRELED